MFTGIVEEIGDVVALEHAGDSAVLTLRAARITDDISHGASIAVNGVCLTVVGWTPGGDGLDVAFDVMGESLKRSSLGALDVGSRVNLERAMRADGRLDGHVVQGHVDGTGTVLSRTCGDNWDTVRFGIPIDLARFVAEKGSIAVDGVSLTVSAVGSDESSAGDGGMTGGGASRRYYFEVGLIPETLRATTLGGKAAGDPVNLEVDVLAKYVARLAEVQATQ